METNYLISNLSRHTIKDNGFRIQADLIIIVETYIGFYNYVKSIGR